MMFQGGPTKLFVEAAESVVSAAEVGLVAPRERLGEAQRAADDAEDELGDKRET